MIKKHIIGFVIMLISKGAEGNIYLEELLTRKVIIKKRNPKEYRNPNLDKSIKVQRTKQESQIIHKAKQAGVPTPIIYHVDMKEATIIMEYIDGVQLKKILNNISSQKRIEICHPMFDLFRFLV